MEGPAACKKYMYIYERQTHTSCNPNTYSNPNIQTARKHKPRRHTQIVHVLYLAGSWMRDCYSRAVVKTLQYTERYTAKWPQVWACYSMCRDHIMCTEIHKKSLHLRRGRQWVIKMKMHGCCKVYEGFLQSKLLQGIITRHMWLIQ